MSKISTQIEEVKLEAFYRTIEITQMFSQLNTFDNSSDTSSSSSNAKFAEKYFLARSIVVFSYATIEKFVKSLTQHALTAILDNDCLIENTRDFLRIVKYQKSTSNLFNLLMYYKNNSTGENNFEFAVNKGYFSNRDRVDAKTIAHIADVLDLNKNEPILKIPKLTLDSLSTIRMDLAHGDYMRDLKKILNPNRTSLTFDDIDLIISEAFRLNDNTQDDLINFIKDFKEKIVALLNDIEVYAQIKSSS
ncbi:hypothetical protein BCD91_004396 [Clostridium beijerinckii]|uniref:HEPN domain-containing protein n=1 Tax=Clostridium beijerinckii TaxID=1520 RepID=UPI001493E270|nr:HEPN domain-containing protein [Clostridium beijerinckii]NOW92373.1 hypothetical protein [Clostridium beijerinckii]